MSIYDSGDDSTGKAISRDEMLAVRRHLQTQFAAIPLAYSIDGKTFGYEAPLDYPIPAGSYVQIETDDGLTFLGQIISKSVRTHEGPELEIRTAKRIEINLEGAQVSQAIVRPTILFVEGEGILLGCRSENVLRVPRSTDVFRDANLLAARSDLINLHLLGDRNANRLEIGTATYSDDASTVSLSPRGFGRHTFLCGQSGSGKTYALGVLIERLLLNTELRVLIIDPNSDFVRLDSIRAGAPDSFSQQEINQYRSLVSDIRVLRPEAEDPESRLVISFGDLAHHEQALVLQLDPLEDREEYSSFWRIVDQIGRENVELSDVQDEALHDPTAESRQISLRIRNLGISDWSIWCRPGESSFLDDLEAPWRGKVLDIGTFGLSAEKQIATLALLSRLWRQRERRQPVLIVIDEAHNICPSEPENDLQDLLTQYVVRVAAEGRKFGLYLLLCSQRPQKIHPNVLSQCDNLILMRMNSKSDLGLLSEVFSFVPHDLIVEAAQFRQGETLVAGPISSTPTFVRIGPRLTEEGGSDIPASWAEPHTRH